MKKTLTLLFISFLTFSIFAQSDDDLFGDDDFFGDDSIEEVVDVSAKSDLSKGVIFDTGSIKVGGSLTAGISTNTVLYSPSSTDFGDNLKNTKLKPDLSALLSVDARPTETLRIYTKFGLAYPFVNSMSGYLKTDLTGNVTPDYFGIDANMTPFVGANFNLTRAGIHADGMMKNPEIYNIFDTETLLNRPPKVSITNTSGVAGIAFWVNEYRRKHGEDELPKTDSLIQKIYDWVTEEYDLGRVTMISDAELEQKYKELIS